MSVFLPNTLITTLSPLFTPVLFMPLLPHCLLLHPCQSAAWQTRRLPHQHTHVKPRRSAPQR
ncbi:hypothetical protein E2C01_064029 [Portunus trituberculatus]|uniref:Uncharacterized protein n=1 Tax=Portunus trituberculatus TaxID=210409 RepID=A0A5B7HM64_PORTR|nr:hypothetical protein [Portunus trituberculatus]